VTKKNDQAEKNGAAALNKSPCCIEYSLSNSKAETHMSGERGGRHFWIKEGKAGAPDLSNKTHRLGNQLGTKRDGGASNVP